MALFPAIAIPEALLSIQELEKGIDNFVEYVDGEWIGVITVNKFCCSSELT